MSNNTDVPTKKLCGFFITVIVETKVSCGNIIICKVVLSIGLQIVTNCSNIYNAAYSGENGAYPPIKRGSIHPLMS